MIFSKHLIASLQTHWLSWATALLILLVFWFLGFMLFRLIYHYLSKWSEKTETQLDDIFINSSKYHIILWSFLMGAYIAGKTAPLGPHVTAVLTRVILSLLLLSITFLVAKITSLLIVNYGKKANVSLPLTSLTDTLVRLIIIILGILLLLANLGISITPILTALGVGSLAVALALQDTLSNLFAGFNILASKQLSPGDYVRLDSGQEGYIVDISWRTTRIRELANNIIIVPNTKISSSIITNYYAPNKETSALVQVGVSYASNLERVEQVTVEVAEETLKTVPGGVPGAKPFIRYHTLGDSDIKFTVILQILQHTDKFLIIHEFIKRLHKRYEQEGIEIPFPQRVVHLQKNITPQ